MPHFLLENYKIDNNIITLNNKDILKHLMVMRLNIGETTKFIDKNKIRYFANTLSINKTEGKFEIINKEICTRELNFNITLAQCLLKNNESEAIANATQIGVKKIQPLFSERTSVKKNTVNTEKFKKIAYENFKQCERADLPEILEPINLEKYIENKKNVIIFGEREVNTNLAEALNKLDKKNEIIIVIGPEGGFSDSEFDLFKKNNYPIVSLGNTILKAENAITAGVSNLVYELSR